MLSQEEAKLRAVQAQCREGQLPRGDSERGMSPGVLAMERLASMLGERFGQLTLLNRRTQLTHAAYRLCLSPLPASTMVKDGVSRSLSVCPPPYVPALSAKLGEKSGTCTLM